VVLGLRVVDLYGNCMRGDRLSHRFLWVRHGTHRFTAPSTRVENIEEYEFAFVFRALKRDFVMLFPERRGFGVHNAILR
jgi:hypothetical protein